MIAPSRQAAYEVLRAVNGGHADLPNALARARVKLGDERDRALAGEIATGTLRWQAAFDHVIAEFARRPVAKLDPEVVDILRLTAFQLLHLDRVPASAAVNDAVNLTRKAGKKSAAPLVNAVLRRISRERDRLPLPKKGAGTFAEKCLAPLSTVDIGGWHFRGKVPATFWGEALDYLSITLSHPRWLVERWLDRYGFEATEAWAMFDNAPAALTVRANTLRTTREELAAKLAEAGIEVEPTSYAPDGLIVRSGNPLTANVGAREAFSVQDEASQLIAVFADARPGERVLDLCASPGGKTTAMAAAMRNEGFIVASDVRGRRIELLRRTVAASAATIVRIVQADASAQLPFGPSKGARHFSAKGAGHLFDRILLDAPCSGLGTLRRDPDIRWRRDEVSLGPLAAAQRGMLERAAAVLAPGGRLVYSTCSSEPDENEAVVEGFLVAHPGFRLAAADECPAPIHRFLTPPGYFRTLPFRDKLEAFFAAMLVKTKDLQ